MARLGRGTGSSELIVNKENYPRRDVRLKRIVCIIKRNTAEEYLRDVLKKTVMEAAQ
jgi:hypothetical protein